MIGDGGPRRVFSQLLEACKSNVGVDLIVLACNYAERLPAWEQQ